MRDGLGDAMNGTSNGAVVVSAAVVLGVRVMGQQATTMQASATKTAPVKRVIVVSLEDRKLALVEEGQIKKVYTVAVGKPTTPSPNREVHDYAAHQEPNLFARWQNRSAGTGKSGGDAVDGTEREGLRNSRNE